MKKIVVVDDHPLLRAGWASLIQPEQHLRICGSVGTVGKALDAVDCTLPDLVLTDISLPDRSGFELISELRIRFPHLPVLVVSMHDEMSYGERVLRAGARGYLMKEAGPELLVTAIREVLAGRFFASPALAERMIRVVPPHVPLTRIGAIRSGLFLRITDSEDTND